MMTRPEWCDRLRQMPQAVRRAALGVFDSITGGALHDAVAWVPVHGKDAPAGETLGPDTNREREMRDQRLHAVQQVLTYLVSKTDLVTGDVCRDKDKTFIGVKIETVAEELGLEQRRVERALRDLHAAGLIQSWKRAEQKGNGWRGRTSIRKLAMHHITALIGQAQTWADAAKQAVKDRAAIPVSVQELALRALRQQARQQTEARNVGQVLARALGGAPPPIGPPLRTR